MEKKTGISVKTRKYDSIEYSPGVIVRKIVMYAILILISVAFIAPIAFMFFGAFKTTMELARVPFKWLPDSFSLANFKAVFEKIPFFLYLNNTLIIVFLF